MIWNSKLKKLKNQILGRLWVMAWFSLELACPSSYLKDIEGDKLQKDAHLSGLSPAGIAFSQVFSCLYFLFCDCILTCS